ncbi:divalent-cation tolerance protein CutA [Aphanothece microscopica]
MTLLLAITTEAGQEQAETLARAVLEARLAACVALTPLQSLYHWQGELVTGHEVQLLIKSRPEQLQELEALVHRLHSYDTPEWIHWEASCSRGYGAWLTACGPGNAECSSDLR